VAIAQVAAEGRLPVRPCRNEPEEVEPPAGRHRGEETGDGGGPLVLERLGRHRQPGVVGEQRHDTLYVAALEGVGEARHELALVARVRQRHLFARRKAHAGVERRPRPVERAVDRGLGDAERLGHLGRAEAEHVAQHEHDPLARREPLEAGDEREPDRLARLVARIRLARAVDDALEQSVGVGLEPERLAATGGLRRPRSLVGRRRQLGRPPPPIAQRVEAAVGGDPVQPGPQRRAALEAVEPAPGSQQRLLHEVLRVVDGTHDPVAVRLQLAAERSGELAEGRVVVNRRPPRRRRHASDCAIARRSSSAS
jgi:hypothetical protein